MGWVSGRASCFMSQEAVARYRCEEREKEYSAIREAMKKIDVPNTDEILKGFDSESEYYKYIEKIKSGK